ncbi:MAG: type I glutamate--ammonia ligase [Aggregatilineales bacterium]
MITKDAILKAVKEQNVKYIDLWFTDILGGIKSVTVPAARVETALDYGTHVDGSSLDGSARVAESDMLLIPDMDTFMVLPWTTDDELTARMICTVHTPQGEPFIGDPRVALINAMEEANKLGFTFKTGVEMEFFLFKTDANNLPIISSYQDNAGYFDLSEDKAQRVRRNMLTTLDQIGICAESTHSEIGYGQHEIDFHYDAALASADKLMTSRVAIKSVAQQHDLHCTFMPRPLAHLPGSGMHTHQSLHDAKSDENIFVDKNHEYGLSETARYFLAGQLAHARAITAIVAPLVNSYKRLGTSFEAPVYVSWAHVNRAALIRIPSNSPGKESHTRLELRCPDPSSNPYLAFAVMLHAGLDGIKQRMELPAPLEESLLMQRRHRLRQVESLPASLGDALEALRQDDVILSALGAYISDRYLEAKRQEYDEYNRYVTQWELDHYLTRY